GTQRTRRREDEPEGRSRNNNPLPRNKPPRDDEDRPQRWKAASRKKSGGQALWITLAVAFLVVMSAGAIVLVRGSNRGAGDNAAGADGPNPFGAGGLRVSPRDVNRPARPAGWIDFHHPNSLYWVYVPKEAKPVHSLVAEGGDFRRVPTEDGFSSQD